MAENRFDKYARKLVEVMNERSMGSGFSMLRTAFVRDDDMDTGGYGPGEYMVTVSWNPDSVEHDPVRKAVQLLLNNGYLVEKVVPTRGK